jgi:hypothetical protein
MSFSEESEPEPLPELNNDETSFNTDILDLNENESDIYQTPSDSIPNSELLIDLSRFQQNVNTYYKAFTQDVTLYYQCVPLIFYMDYKPLEMYENSQKIIAPKDLLNQLSLYEDLQLPIFVKLNESEQIFGIIDYIDFVDHLYIPSKHFYDLNISENQEIKITILKEKPVNAESIKIKPLSEQFYEIKNIKVYLEVWLKKMFLTLSEDEIISLPYQNTVIGLYIAETKPTKMVSIYDIEEVEIDLLPMDEYANKKTEVISECINKEEEIESENKQDAEVEPNTTFKSFSGVGNKLGSN